MRPSRNLLYLLAVWCGLALLASLSPFLAMSSAMVDVWKTVGVVILVAALVDALRWKHSLKLDVTRQVPMNMALGQAYDIEVKVTNESPHPIAVEVTDHAPSQMNAAGLPVSTNIEAKAYAEFSYSVRATGRGLAIFPGAELRVSSRWRLWQFRVRKTLPSEVRVYPNFSKLSSFDLFGIDRQIAQLGVHMAPRRGQGMDFHQLREYRQGDALRQLDWKASSRHSKLISKDYREERDQDVILLLDSGRRMRAKDGDLSHFDHCLNAALLLAFIALKQGDAIGTLSFAGAERWLPPVKGSGGINAMMNQLYDLFSTTETSDYLASAESFTKRHRKRSLVILVTNLRGEDADDLRSALQLLSRRHLVIVASLRETVLEETLKKPVTNEKEALTYASVCESLEQRERLLDEMRAKRFLVVDALPEQLHIELINQYLMLKRSGRI